MNKKLKNITLRREYTGIISFKTFWIKIFQISVTSYKDWQLFIRKKTFLTFPTLYFTQRKRKIYDANNLLVLPHVSIINYNYSLGKNVYCNNSIRWYCLMQKPFNEKMHGQLVKRREKSKTCEQFFNTFNLWYENKEKTQICCVGIKILTNSQNTTIFTQPT